MNTPIVYFHPVKNQNSYNISQITSQLVEKIITDNAITLQEKLPVKVHTGQPGNITFIRPVNYQDTITYVQSKGVQPYFVETNMVTGPRSKASTHLKVAQDHGFTQIPVVIADGENGDDQVFVEISGGKHFTQARIARVLAESPQVLVMSHFKGHIDAGFGAALKMLGIGFASREGKIEQHSNDFSYHMKLGTIEWEENDKIYHGKVFCERVAEYAQAATKNKQNIYVNFALNLVTDCDCDGVPMKPIYKDLGIFVSLDPVAIDKACFDLLEEREKKKPYHDWDIFPYAEKLGLGSTRYQLVTV